MKKKTPSALVPVRKAKPAAEPTAVTIAARLPKIKGKTPGERINFLHQLSVASGKLSIVAGILAGWELSKARAACDHGAWLAWLEANTAISKSTAQNYIAVYASTLGAARASLPEPVPLATAPTNAELQAAAANVEASSITGLYQQLQLLKRNANHGGPRPGAGRKPKAEDVAAELEAVAQAPELIWASAKGALDILVRLDEEKDFLRRLGDEQLAAVVSILGPLAQKAAELFAGRADCSRDAAAAAAIAAITP
jgi:hypothetical protein